MKKFISILVSFMIMTTTVFANAADALVTALEKSQELTSANVQMVFETELNKPLEILDTIPMEADEYTDINPRMIIESLIESTMMINCSYSASEDYKKMSMAMSMEFDVPVSLNADFKLAAWTKLGMWMEYDITDTENPVCKVIYKIPFMKKYMVLDMSEYYKNNPDMLTVIDKENIKNLNKKAMDALMSNATVSKTSGGYTIKLTDEGAKKYYIECMKLAKDVIPSDNVAYSEFENILSAIEYFCEKVTVFGKDGLTMSVSVNPSGFITAEAVDMHISMNVYDILTAYSKNTKGLEREKAFVDMTAKTSVKITNHNKEKVEMPVLTDENSELERYLAYPTYSSYYNYSQEPPLLVNDSIYYPIEAMAAQCGMTVEKGDNSITVTDGDNVVAIEGDKINGEEFETAAPLLINENDKLYCLEDALYPLGINIGSMSYDMDKKQIEFTFFYEKPEQYEEEITYEEPEEDVEEYIPMYLDYSFYLDRLPLEKNGVVYMPVYEFVGALYNGQFEFGTNSITYSADGENDFGIQAISAKTGDKFVTVNGEARSLDAPVEEKEGVIYIPIAFADSLGLEYGFDVHYSQVSGSSTWFNFNRKNPDYNGEEYYDFYEPFSYYFVESDQLPHMSEDTIYIPIYDLLIEMYNGEFSFTENGFTYTAKGKNAFDIETVSVYNGDKFVTVDGEKVELSNEVIMVNDILRVPISFVESMGLTVDDINIRTYNNHTSYWLTKTTSYENDSADLNWYETLF